MNLIEFYKKCTIKYLKNYKKCTKLNIYLFYHNFIAKILQEELGLAVFDEIGGGKEKERNKKCGRVHLNIDNTDSFR